MIRVVEGFLDQELSADRWRVRSMRVPETLWLDAVAAWIEADGGRAGRWVRPDAPYVDLFAAECAVEAKDADSAAVKGSSFLDPLIRAISFRQLRPGVVVATLTIDEQNVAHAFRQYVSVSQVHYASDEAGWSPERDVAWLAAVIHASPVGTFLLGLFSDALKEQDPTACIVRLWSLLEVLAGRFPDRSAYRRVTEALTRLEVAEGVDLKGAYRARNAFVHEGMRGEEPHLANLRSGLVKAIYTTLVRSDFAQVDPASSAWSPGKDHPTGNISLRQSD